MSLLDSLLVRTLPVLPRALVGVFARPYVAGESETDAVRVVRDLNQHGMMATIDILGEFIHEPAQARAATDGYLRLLDTIDRERLDANVSLKLSQFGLKLDRKLCRDNLVGVLDRAAGLGRFVRIDMEDSGCTDATLDLFHELRPGRSNVGVVLQAMLRRTLADARALGAERVNVRVCKGIYREPVELAYHGRDEVRDSFLASVEALLGAGSYVGIATHDEVLVERAQALVRRLGLAPTAYEFQMLLGVRESLRDSIVAAGHRLRVYVPFGRDWYAYSMRRLRENPTIARYVARAVLTGEAWSRRRPGSG